jgi:hypothetical protein
MSIDTDRLVTMPSGSETRTLCLDARLVLFRFLPGFFTVVIPTQNSRSGKASEGRGPSGQPIWRSALQFSATCEKCCLAEEHAVGVVNQEGCAVGEKAWGSL